MDENQKDDIFIQKPHVIKKNVFEPDADENMQFQSQATELLSARNAFALRGLRMPGLLGAEAVLCMPGARPGDGGGANGVLRKGSEGCRE